MQLGLALRTVDTVRRRGYMFIFEKRTQIPVVIKNRNPRLASYILTQYGGPDGELGAALRYLSQRFSQTDKRAIAILTDIGTS